MHCSLEGQDRIAHFLQTIFGSTNQLQMPVDAEHAKTFAALHSPEELKYKLLVKGKRTVASISAAPGGSPRDHDGFDEEARSEPRFEPDAISHELPGLPPPSTTFHQEDGFDDDEEEDEEELAILSAAEMSTARGVVARRGGRRG